MVICSTCDLGSGTLPTRMSRAESMRDLVSVSSIRSVHEMVEGDVVFYVFGNHITPLVEGANLRERHFGVVGQPSEFAGVHDGADAAIGDIRFEELADNRHVGGVGFVD